MLFNNKLYAEKKADYLVVPNNIYSLIGVTVSNYIS